MIIFPIPPADASGIPNYLQALNIALEELNRPELQHLQLEEWNYEPQNKINNMIAKADGTNWNPGSGEGVYWYKAATDTWNFLG